MLLIFWASLKKKILTTIAANSARICNLLKSTYPTVENSMCDNFNLLEIH